MDDSLSAAFNAHNANALMSLFATDLEFYHDTQGVQDYQAVSAGFRSLFASNSNIRRERVGALEVYPVRGYGAIEVGAHKFCHTEGGRRDCGTFKFVQLWRREMSGWKIARVVSYGH
jgi:ketosteroid isomerase-like protein